MNRGSWTRSSVALAALFLGVAAIGHLRKERPFKGTAAPSTERGPAPDMIGEPTTPRDTKLLQERPGKVVEVDESGSSGEGHGLLLSEQHLPTEELFPELASLRSRLSEKAFNKVMEMLGGSSPYSPQEKAAAFNKFLPVESTPGVYPVYQEVLLDWGMLPGNSENFFQFIDGLDSTAMQENLAMSYYLATCKSMDDLTGLIQVEAEKSNPSYFGENMDRRARSVSRLVDQLILNNNTSPQEAKDFITRMEIDEEFKTSLLHSIAE